MGDRWGIAKIVLALACVDGAHAQMTTPLADSIAQPRGAEHTSGGPYFYRGLGYGSDVVVGPLDVVLNKGFALAQTEWGRRDIFSIPYGWGSVSDALFHPRATIERGGGLWDFIRKEMLPLSFKPADIKWYTNYTGHLIEGGIHYRRLAEWYEARGVPMAGLLSGIVNVGSALLNEAYEHLGGGTPSAGTIADIYFFDLGGILLFTSDAVARFFAETLHANVWTGQASVAFPSGELHNNGAYLVFKFPWGVVPKSSVFFWTGIGAGLGLTYHGDDGLDLSVAIGNDANRMIVDPVTGEEFAEFSPSGVAFLDRYGSVLASLHVSMLEHRIAKLNIYPGVLPGPWGSLGAWLVVSRNLEVRFGVISRYSLGAGLGFGR